MVFKSRRIGTSINGKTFRNSFRYAGEPSFSERKRALVPRPFCTANCLPYHRTKFLFKLSKHFFYLTLYTFIDPVMISKRKRKTPIFRLLQALNGFLLILTCDGEVFFATHSIESYLGFHQVRETSLPHTRAVNVKYNTATSLRLAKL